MSQSFHAYKQYNPHAEERKAVYDSESASNFNRHITNIYLNQDGSDTYKFYEQV